MMFIQMQKIFSKVRYSIILVGSFCIMANALAAKNSEETLDKIIVVVNETPIMQSDLTDAVNTAKKQIAASNIPQPPDYILRKQVLEQMINRKLQLQLAEQAGIHITDEDVTKALQNIAASNHISVKELLEKVKSQGIDILEYKNEIKEELAIQQVAQMEVGSHITITPQEVDDFMRSSTWKQYNGKEYHLEDILIALPDTPSPQDVENAKKQANAVLAKLHKGKSFQEVAMEDSGSGALQGGDLGWRQLPQIPSAFASQLVNMKTNDIMGPVSTPNGFHIIRLAGVRDSGEHIKAADQRKQIEQLIFQRKMEEGVQAWITKLRGAAFINMHLEN